MNNKQLEIVAFRCNWQDFEMPSEDGLLGHLNYEKLTLQQYFEKYRPKAKHKLAWIPQTIGDQHWIYYGFYSKKEKDEWLKTLPEILINSICPSLIKHIDDYGWHIRDTLTGFIVKQ
jgi:hypothetical protein